MFYIFDAIARILSFILDWFLKVTPFKEDVHDAPHMMRDGGCFCACTKCVQTLDGFNRCICTRCNEECTSFGRLGRAIQVRIEQEDGYPKGGKPAAWIYLP
jgi:hypothetical protein